MQWAEFAESHQDLPASSAMMFSNLSLSQCLFFGRCHHAIVLRINLVKLPFLESDKGPKKNPHHATTMFDIFGELVHMLASCC